MSITQLYIPAGMLATTRVTGVGNGVFGTEGSAAWCTPVTNASYGRVFRCAARTPARTHNETSRLGKQADTYDKSGAPDAGHPRHDSGINRWSPLTILQLFNIILDVCPDMMHIIKCLLGGHWIPLLKGERVIARPRFKTKKTDAEYARKEATYKANCRVIPCTHQA